MLRSCHHRQKLDNIKKCPLLTLGEVHHRNEGGEQGPFRLLPEIATIGRLLSCRVRDEVLCQNGAVDFRLVRVEVRKRIESVGSSEVNKVEAPYFIPELKEFVSRCRENFTFGVRHNIGSVPLMKIRHHEVARLT